MEFAEKRERIFLRGLCVLCGEFSLRGKKRGLSFGLTGVKSCLKRICMK